MIRSRIPAEEYFGIEALNISRLKEMKRSPQHYQWFMHNRRETSALTLGTAAHVSTLEPERFDRDYAIWAERTEGGAMSPRRGKRWDEFCSNNPGKSFLTQPEALTAGAISKAVRSNDAAMKYLGSGEPEVTLEWKLDERRCKGRVDWITTVDGEPVIVGLKTARDCRHFAFGSAAAKLGYHLQWAFNYDGWVMLRSQKPKMIEIVVESAPPHAVAVYRITDDILDQGRDDYFTLIATLIECERTGYWPGPVPVEEPLSLPSWAFDAADDLDGIDLDLGEG